MRLGAPGAMLRRLAGKIFGVNGPQCDAGCTALLTQAAFAQNAHVVVESSFAYAIEANSSRRLNGTNLFDRKQVGHNDGIAPPHGYWLGRPGK
jgi:outer membrane receptor for ferric coprogen and ferric-rhodotorulic acid